MKRLFDATLEVLLGSTGDLALDELHRVRLHCERQLSQHYSARAWATTTHFFATVADSVFLLRVLNPLARSERVQFMASLRVVCKQWHSLMLCVDHLTFGMNDWTGTLYPIALSRFTCVTSIRAHRRILMHYNNRVKEFGQVRELIIAKLAHDEEPRYSYDVTQWTSLTCLDFRDSDGVVKGIEQLTALQSLKIGVAAFRGHSEDLLGLTQLKKLRIRHFPEEFDPRKLPALQRLKSDSALHFAHYTGAGVLVCEDKADFEDEQAARDLYHPECWNAQFTGHWVNGVFSGIASYQYGDDCSDFYGLFVDGKREGPGEEECQTEKLYYKGEWKAGLRHGLFEVSSWTGFGNRVYTLERTERWEHGQRVTEEKCLAL